MDESDEGGVPLNIKTGINSIVVENIEDDKSFDEEPQG